MSVETTSANAAVPTVLPAMPWALTQAAIGIAWAASAFVLVTGWLWWSLGNLLAGIAALAAAATWSRKAFPLYAAGTALGVAGGVNLLVLGLALAGGGASPLILLPAAAAVGQGALIWLRLRAV